MIFNSAQLSDVDGFRELFVSAFFIHSHQLRIFWEKGVKFLKRRFWFYPVPQISLLIALTARFPYLAGLRINIAVR